MNQSANLIDEEISSLFNNAITKLDKVDAQAEQEKKQIIIQLAKELEGKIPTYTISIEIVNQLRDRVSERFIRKCLDEKYKQNHRVQNARKQKKQECTENHLAAPVPLNQGDEKEAITIDNDGREEMIASSPRAKQQDPKSVEANTVEYTGSAQVRNGSQNIQKRSLDTEIEKDRKLAQLNDKLKEYEERNEKLQEDLRRGQVIIVRISLRECKKIAKLMGIPLDLIDNIEESATEIYEIIDGEELEEMGLPV